MKVTKVILRGYGVFREETTLEVGDRGLVLVLGSNRDEPHMDSNGAGKSSAFEGLDWCLWGIPPKRDHVDSIISDGFSECQVVTYLDDDGVSLVIDRTKYRAKSQKLSFTHGKTKVEALDLAETQRRLDDVIGMDRDLFHSTVFFSQNSDFDFADSSSDADRMRLITKMFGLYEIDAWLLRTKEALKDVGVEESKLVSDLARVAGRREGLEAQVGSFRQQASVWEEERAQSLRSALVQYNDMIAHVERSRAMVVQKPQVEQAVKSVSLGFVRSDWSEFQNRVREAKQRCEAAVANEAAVRSLGASKRSKRNAFAKKKEGLCSECGQVVTDDHLASELSRMDSELEELRSRWEVADSEASTARSILAAVEREFQAAQEAHREAAEIQNRELREANKLLGDICQAEEYLSKADPHLDHLRKSMEVCQQNVNPWLAKEAEIQESIAAAGVEEKEIARKLGELRSSKAYLEFWETAFGPKGLKNYILDSRLDEMTRAANHWVSVLTGGTIWVRFETQTMGRSTKKLSNKISIRVFRYNPDGSVSERGYRSWSGGEKRRVGWAVNFGLSRVAAKRMRKHLDLLILDEVFRHVDASGGEAVVRMLRELQREKSSIFVVEHDESFKGFFEDRMLVQKAGGSSQILDGGV